MGSEGKFKSKAWCHGNNGSGAFRKAFFDNKEPEAVVVLEIGCKWTGKPEQAAANAEYIDMMMRHSGIAAPVYKGIAFWRDGNPEALEAEMEHYGIDFALQHLLVPGNTLRRIPRKVRHALREEAMAAGAVQPDENLTDRLAHKLIVEGNGEYSSVRGKLAYHASLGIIAKEAYSKPRGKVLEDIHLIPPGCVVNGRRVFVRGDKEGGQVDCVLVYDKAAGLAGFVDRMSRRECMEVRSRLSL